jgi:hypothetical protein
VPQTNHPFLVSLFTGIPNVPRNLGDDIPVFKVGCTSRYFFIIGYFQLRTYTGRVIPTHHSQRFMRLALVVQHLAANGHNKPNAVLA